MKIRIILLAGLAICTLFGACGKNNETANAEANKTSSNTVQTENTWYYDWDKGMEAAKKEHKPVYVHFTAEWCKWCHTMRKETYAAAEINNRFKDGWITISIDTDDNNKTGKVYLDEKTKKAIAYLHGEKGNYEEKTLTNLQLMQFFGGSGLPTLLFIDKEGIPLQKISSFIEKEEFAVILDFFKEEAYNTTSFDEFKKSHKGTGN